MNGVCTPPHHMIVSIIHVSHIPACHLTCYNVISQCSMPCSTVNHLFLNSWPQIWMVLWWTEVSHPEHLPVLSGCPNTKLLPNSSWSIPFNVYLATSIHQRRGIPSTYTRGVTLYHPIKRSSMLYSGFNVTLWGNLTKLNCSEGTFRHVCSIWNNWS